MGLPSYKPSVDVAQYFFQVLDHKWTMVGCEQQRRKNPFSLASQKYCFVQVESMPREF